MTSQNDNKALDIQVMAKMRDLGIFGHLNAHFLSDFAVAVQDSDLDSLKMYKDVKNTTDYQLAADFVIQYLKRHHLEYTLNAVSAETNDKIIPPKNITKDVLHFKSKDYFEEALNVYLQDGDQPSEIKEQNHERFREELKERLDSIKKAPRSTK
ncbi:hypothetical protein TRFO_02233 [Tritrichomonas foetus]|uniref:LisH domain-containing protein n=1 Tax=Tritrichomonas foetus TaxID=1144522 RepID=A0A1J4J7P7_9EUKA|nr:hypothetical protein TRFO_02233 [Tritrichomonas foetus]|eukprot:OHS95250.1 hypothetical protein TRFO_02233 [Tritrichomonas foetus]